MKSAATTRTYRTIYNVIFGSVIASLICVSIVFIIVFIKFVILRPSPILTPTPTAIPPSPVPPSPIPPSCKPIDSSNPSYSHFQWLKKNWQNYDSLKDHHTDADIQQYLFCNEPALGIPCHPFYGGDCTMFKAVVPAFPTTSSVKCSGYKAIGGSTLESQSANTVQLVNNTTEDPLHVYVEYANFNKTATGNNSLDPPSSYWNIHDYVGTSAISAPIGFYPTINIPSGVTTSIQDPNDVGSGTWQIVTMTPGSSIILDIPEFKAGQPWSLRPVKYITQNGKLQACNNNGGDCGKPILIECGKDMVGDMSAVDGVNFLARYEFSSRQGPSVIDFNTNPCQAIGAKSNKGCINPSVDGIFSPALVNTPQCLEVDGDGHKVVSKRGTCWVSLPCPAGTCNLTGKSLAWCDSIHCGQCANSTSRWSEGQRAGGPTSCSGSNSFTTYCYSHDDATSSPYLSPPYKVKVIYSDLVAGNVTSSTSLTSGISREPQPSLYNTSIP